MERTQATSVMTSQTHPIRVDWLPLSDHRPKWVRIGMTFAPGKKADSKYGDGRWERDLDADLTRLVEVCGVQTLVSLIEDHERARYGIPALLPRAREVGLEVVRFPISDGGIRREGLVELLTEIEHRSFLGEVVVIHCIGGLGRTGMVAGALLVRAGFSVDDAFRILSRLRGVNCPETEAQREVVREFCLV